MTKEFYRYNHLISLNIILSLILNGVKHGLMTILLQWTVVFQQVLLWY